MHRLVWGALLLREDLSPEERARFEAWDSEHPAELPAGPHGSVRIEALISEARQAVREASVEERRAMFEAAPRREG